MIWSIRQNVKRLVFTTITRIMGTENGQVILPVLRGPAKGLYFKLDLQTRMEAGYFYGSYDLPVLRQSQQIIQKGWIIWDCGTYLGFYTAFFARLVGTKGQVVAFEPDPHNLRRTQENVRLNKLTNVQFVQAAIGSPVGKIDFVISNNTNSHVSGTFVGASQEDYARIERMDGSIQVRCLSLDQAYLDQTIPKPHLIKLDIEGSEKDALLFAEQIIHEVKPLIILELHNPECDTAAWLFAQRTGYSLQSLTTGRILHKPEEVTGTLLCYPM